MKICQAFLLVTLLAFANARDTGEGEVKLRKLTPSQLIGSSPSVVDSESKWTKFKGLLIELKKDLPGYKKSGALSYRCKSGECELCFSGTGHKVCSEVSYGTTQQKRGVFTFLVAIDDVGLKLPLVTGDTKPNTVVCSKLKMLNEVCMKISKIQASTLNDGKANICFELQLAGTNIFHACIEGTKTSLFVSKA